MIDFEAISKQIRVSLPESVRNPLAAFGRISARLLYTFRQQFLTGGYGHWMPQKYPTGGKLMMRSHALYESGTTHSNAESAQLNWGFGLPYARIHQTGGMANPNVTAQSRKYFWRRFYETGNDMFKWMALSKKTVFSVSIPARPISLTSEDIQYIAAILGTRDFKITTNYGASIIPY